MSPSRKVTMLLRAATLAIVTLGTTMGLCLSAANAESAASVSTTSAAATVSSSYCHAGPRPDYSCGPYGNFYDCEAMADIFEMFGYYPAECWYFPKGNLGGSPGYYF